VTQDPRAFLGLDLGAATASASLIGRYAGRWRLIGSLSLPAGVGLRATARLLVDRTIAADPGLAAMLGLDQGRSGTVPTVAVRSHPPRRLAVVAVTERALAPLAAAAARSGWLVSAVSAETTEPLAMSRLLLEPTVDAVLAGAGDPPGGDERSGLDELALVVAAAAERRSETTFVLAGALTDGLARFGDGHDRAAEVVLAPAAATGPGGAPLRDLLTALAMPAGESRLALGVAAATLADVLDRRVEIVEIGHDAGLRAVAAPGAGGGSSSLDAAVVAAAALAPADPDDAVIDRVLGWSTLPTDRHRVRDGMRELRIVPWADASGDGAAFRLAAARAAVGRLIEATPDIDLAGPPDLVVAAGGTWAVAPAPVVALALADVLRRPGASQYALDHAALLAPLGAIPDPVERAAVLADIADDLLAPLGSVVTPAGLRPGRAAGRLVVHAAGGTSEVELVPGGLELIDLAPGETAVAEFRFRDTVRLGTRGRHFAIDVAGGLGGLLVDLRDVPLRLPDRHDRRREQLDAWQSAMWGGARS